MPDHFEATFRLQVDPTVAWHRLTEHLDDAEAGGSGWLPGFDSAVTVVESDGGRRLRARKDDEPCAGTDIVITIEDDDGTHIRVVQSRFGDWLPARYELMSVGWRYIVADLQLYLATGAHARRHLRPWVDLGADVTTVGGAIRIGEPRPSGLAHRLGMQAGDLVVAVADAPVASLDDLVTALRAARPDERTTVEWVRDGVPMNAPTDHR